MAAEVIQFQRKVQESSQGWGIRIGKFSLRKSSALLLLFMCLMFLSALYYVEQQVQLQRLNYKIIALKQQKKELIEQQKTYQLQLHQLPRLDRVEQDVRAQGFAPIEKEQLRIVQ
jgi:hypothetical protein